MNTCIGLYGAVFPSVRHSSFVRFTSYSFIGHSTPSCFFSQFFVCKNPKLLDNIIAHKKRSEFSSLLSPVDCGLVNVIFAFWMISVFYLKTWTNHACSMNFFIRQLFTVCDARNKQTAWSLVWEQKLHMISNIGNERTKNKPKNI